MNKFMFRFMAGMVLLLGILCLGCTSPLDSPDEPPVKTGDIAGKAYFSNASNHGGITVILEKTNGLQSVGVLRSQELGRAVRSAEGALTTTTGKDGSRRNGVRSKHSRYEKSYGMRREI